MVQLGVEQATRLRLLLDSNVIIAAEPYDGHLESEMTDATRLLRLANEQGHVLCYAPATEEDLRESADPQRRTQRLAELGKFSRLGEVAPSPSLQAAFPAAEPGSNDHRDLRILAALEAGAAGLLVTNDVRLRRRARRAGLGEATLSLAEAVDLLLGFAPTEVPLPPRVTRIESYQIDSTQSIFDGLREDYPPFDAWLEKVKRDSDQRDCYVVLQEDRYAALAILKHEDEPAHGLDGPWLKICTFKVAADFAGSKYGELLLKSVLLHAIERGEQRLYVEVLNHHPEVIDFMTTFGFRIATEVETTLVLVKELAGAGVTYPESDDLSDLEYHVRYGPPAIRGRQSMFVIPIQPQWHEQLFPELEPASSAQLSLFAEDNRLTHPWGNALRKAYLSNSRITTMLPGDVILFYRSQSGVVSAVGVLERALRSPSVEEVTRFVGRRTVYTPEEISTMCRRGVDGVLALLFRQDRFITPGWTRPELTAAGVFKSWPQTITRVPRGGRQWVLDRLTE